MNALLRNALDNLKTKVELLAKDNHALKKDLKQLQAEKTKLETALKKAQADLETHKNIALSEGISDSKKDNTKLINQLDKYIKLIDTSMAQIKSK